MSSPTSSMAQPEPQQPQIAMAATDKAVTLGQYKVIYDTSVYSEPNEHSRAVARIEAGTSVSVVNIKGDWLEIRSRHGRPPGFIRKDSAIPIRVSGFREKNQSVLREHPNTAKEADAPLSRKSSAVTYEEIVESSKVMTTAQFKSYVKKLQGREMEDRGQVGDVTEKWPAWDLSPSQVFTRRTSS